MKTHFPAFLRYLWDAHITTRAVLLTVPICGVGYGIAIWQQNLRLNLTVSAFQLTICVSAMIWATARSIRVARQYVRDSEELQAAAEAHRKATAAATTLFNEISAQQLHTRFGDRP